MPMLLRVFTIMSAAQAIIPIFEQYTKTYGGKKQAFEDAMAPIFEQLFDEQVQMIAGDKILTKEDLKKSVIGSLAAGTTSTIQEIKALDTTQIEMKIHVQNESINMVAHHKATVSETSGKIIKLEPFNPAEMIDAIDKLSKE